MNPGEAPTWAYPVAGMRFTVLPLVNRWGRDEVHKGRFCLRTNENDVDVNRNWDVQWRKHQEGDPAQTSPGSAPFSEAETAAMRDAMTQARPDLFVTVHSGALGMYTPYAYSTDDVVDATRKAKVAAEARAAAAQAGAGQLRGTGDDGKAAQAAEAELAHATKRAGRAVRMHETLASLTAEFGACPHGSAGHELGYLCPGTCLDYAWDRLHVPMTFAFEVWDVQARGNKGGGPSGAAAQPTGQDVFTSFADRVLGGGEAREDAGEARFSPGGVGDDGDGDAAAEAAAARAARAAASGTAMFGERAWLGAAGSGGGDGAWGPLAEAGNAVSANAAPAAAGLGVGGDALLVREATGAAPGAFVLPDLVSQSLAQLGGRAGAKEEPAEAEARIHERAVKDVAAAGETAAKRMVELRGQQEQVAKASADAAERIAQLQAGINADAAREAAARRASIFPEEAAAVGLRPVAMLQAGARSRAERRRAAAAALLLREGGADGQGDAKSAEALSLEDERCLAQFNPVGRQDFDAVLRRWAATIAATGGVVVRALRQGGEL